MKSKKEAVSGTRSMEKHLTINAPAAAVWKALTDGKELTRWFPSEAEVEPGEGGTIRWIWSDHYDWKLEVTTWEEEKHLGLKYDQAQDLKIDETTYAGSEPLIPATPHTLVVDFFLEGKGGTTEVRLVHSGFGSGSEWDDEFDGVNRGWNSELRNLKVYLERFAGRDRELVILTAPSERSLDDLWERIMGPLGANAGKTIHGLQEGGSFHFQPEGDWEFKGDVIYFQPGRDFMGVAENLSGSVLRLIIERHLGRNEVHLWFASYGLSMEKIDRFRTDWKIRVEAVAAQ